MRGISITLGLAAILTLAAGPLTATTPSHGNRDSAAESPRLATSGGDSLAPPVSPIAASFEFPSSLSTVVASIGFIDEIDIGYFWWAARGDSVTQTFSGPPTVNGLQLDVDVRDNLLRPGYAVEWDVRVNDVTVDHFRVRAGFVGKVSRTATFPSLQGPEYEVVLRVTNEIPFNQGAHTFRYAGPGSHQLTLWEGLTLQVAGACPGPLAVVVRGATPGGEVLLLWSQRTGSTTLRTEPCAGTPLGLARPHRLDTFLADSTGMFTAQMRPPGGACGAFIEAVDLTTCVATGAVQIP